MNRELRIGNHTIGAGSPVYIVAEMSANHRQDFDQAARTVEAAKQAGADGVKLQTFTPDTLTIDCSREDFLIRGSPWAGRTLFQLYSEAYMPWDWQPKLAEIARDLGIDLFSTPFDASAVDFLEAMGVPAYKIASFEIVDLPLLRRVAATRMPIILSTGMASLAEIDEAVQVIREAGRESLALLKCTSAYPAPPEGLNLRTIPHLSMAFGIPVGLSDHTLSLAAPIAAVALGACIIEKHFTLSRNSPSPDAAFSLEPAEFRAMVQAIRFAEQAVGEVHYGESEWESDSRMFRRSLYVVHDVRAGELLTQENVRSIRPAGGLHTRYLESVLGRVARRDLQRGTPLTWDVIA